MLGGMRLSVLENPSGWGVVALWSLAPCGVRSSWTAVGREIKKIKAVQILQGYIRVLTCIPSLHTPSFLIPVSTHFCRRQY